MRTRERIVDIPVCLFKESYGISLGNALEIYGRRGKVIIPIIKRYINIPIQEFSERGWKMLKYPVPGGKVLILTDIVVKNKKIVTLRERTSFYQ